MMDEYAYGVPQKYDPNSRMIARKVDKVFSLWFQFIGEINELRNLPCIQQKYLFNLLSICHL